MLFVLPVPAGQRTFCFGFPAEKKTKGWNAGNRRRTSRVFDYAAKADNWKLGMNYERLSEELWWNRWVNSVKTRVVLSDGDRGISGMTRAPTRVACLEFSIVLIFDLVRLFDL